MKLFLVVLLSLLLCGCARQASPVLSETVPEIQAVPAAGLYDPNHPMEQAYPEMIRAYPLTLRKVHGIRAMETDLLVLSGQGSTMLTLLTGENLQEKASLTLEFSLQQEDPSLRIHKSGISFFDALKQETVFLDQQLQEVRRIAAPDGLSGKPILSYDAKVLYYCTGWSVVAWDLESGIRRTVKELSYESQELTGLHCKDQILECSIQHKGDAFQVFLTSDQGLQQNSLWEPLTLHTKDSQYFALLQSGYQRLILFGEAGTAPALLLPERTAEQQFYLPENSAAVTVCSSEGSSRLDYYELSTGLLQSSLTLEPYQTPKNIVNCTDHAVYILVYDPDTDCDVLYRWDVLCQQPDTSNTVSYKTEYRSPDDPDEDALNVCREYADAIGAKYGIALRIWEDAAAVQPWDYRFDAEHLAPVLQKELQALDKRLAQYPAEIFRQTKAHFTGLTLCLVRKITGTGDSQSLSSATGIQFFENQEAYVAITTGKYSEQALYHELYHVMETHILTESTALDSWESLNPAGFVYGSQQDNDVYLQGQTRAFVDRYSMLYPKEDRARVLENAMLPGKEEIFRSEYMQRKLYALCMGIREAYRLEKHPDPLPWEQYLVNTLTPAS